MDWLRNRLNPPPPEPPPPELKASAVNNFAPLGPGNIAHLRRVGHLDITDAAYYLYFFPDNRSLLLDSADDVVRWGIGEAEPMAVLDRRPNIHCALSPDGTLAATATGRSFEDDDEADDDEDDEAEAEDSTADTEGDDAQTTDYRVYLWRFADETLLHALEGPTVPPADLVFAPDGHSIAAVTQDGDVYIWAVDSGQLLYTLPSGDRAYNDIAYLPDGTLAISEPDYQVRLWRPDGERLLTAPDGQGVVRSLLAVSLTGRVLAAAGTDDKVRIWRDFTATGVPPLTLDYDSVEYCVLSPDGTILATIDFAESEICFWRSDTGALLHRLEPEYSVTSMAFAPNRRLFALGIDTYDDEDPPFIEFWAV